MRGRLSSIDENEAARRVELPPGLQLRLYTRLVPQFGIAGWRLGRFSEPDTSTGKRAEVHPMGERLDIVSLGQEDGSVADGIGLFPPSHPSDAQNISIVCTNTGRRGS